MTAASDSKLLEAEDRQRVLIDWNATGKPRNPADTVHGLFRRIVAAQSQRIAVKDGTAQLSYQQLDDLSSRIAGALQAQGVRGGDIVALLLERSANAIAAQLGVLKAGAAYLPVDMHQPSERIAEMLKSADARLLVMSGTVDPALAPAGTPIVTVEQLTQWKSLQFDEMPGNGKSLAYVMYTSGSTGKPKGIEIPHRAIIRLVCPATFARLDADVVVLQGAPLS